MDSFADDSKRRTEAEYGAEILTRKEVAEMPECGRRGRQEAPVVFVLIFSPSINQVPLLGVAVQKTHPDRTPSSVFDVASKSRLSSPMDSSRETRG